ncbi:unnamed protein product [Chrysoparadoxa australica]
MAQGLLNEDEFISIPVRGSDQTVQVYTDELPPDINDVVDVLKAEVAPLDTWLAFAVAYYRQDQKEHFRDILREVIGALSTDMEKFYADDPEAFRLGRIRILNALAADAIKRAVNRVEDDPYMRQAGEYLVGADRIDPMCSLTWVGKGVYWMTVGEVNRAKYQFENALKQPEESIPGHLGRSACVCFCEGKYADALDHYSRVIRLHPNCSAGVRVGLGLCCYHLGQIRRAKAAMKRAMDVDGKCVEAMIGSALLNLYTIEKGSPEATKQTEEAIEMISKAYHFNPSNAMALNHLANHYFWKWVPLKVNGDIADGGAALSCSSVLTNELEPGDNIRIGAKFATKVHSEKGVQGNLVYLEKPYPEAAKQREGLPLFVKDYRKVMTLAQEAFQHTDVKEIKAESCFLLGRVFHAQGKIVDAKTYYSEACIFRPELAPAQYGMAQVHLSQGNDEEAVACLELVLKQVPGNEETLVLLGLLYKRLNQRKQALTKFKHALELNPLLSDAWLAQAQVYQEDPADYELALGSYAKAMGVIQGANSEEVTNSPKTGTKGSLRAIWTNIAVLHDYIEKLPESFSSFEKALGPELADEPVSEDKDPGTLITLSDPANRLFWRWRQLKVKGKLCSSNKVQFSAPVDTKLVRPGVDIRLGSSFLSTVTSVVSPSEFEVLDFEGTSGGLPLEEGEVYVKVLKTRLTPQTVSIIFNMALLHEKQGHHDAASELHKAILSDHPSYLHCYLRLGCIARNAGQIHEASKWFKEALAVAPQNADTLAYFGNLHMRSKEWGPAQKMFEKILETNEGDSYAMLSLGNIYFANLEDKGKYDKHLGHAANFYQRILVADSSNAYAANGLGMVLAEKDNLEQAKDVFARVREVSAEVLGDVWVNLAHVYLAQNKRSEAIRLYQNCLKKFHGGRDSSLHLFLAHAYFDAGRYRDCMVTLHKALHVNPSDLQLWYNLALTQETFAVMVLQKEQNGEQRTLSEVQNAIADLEEAAKLFKWLMDCQQDGSKGASRRLPYNAEKAKKHANFCQSNLSNANQHLQHEMSKEHDKQVQRDRRQQVMDETVRKREQERQEEVLKKAELDAQKEALLRKNEERLSGLVNNWNQQKETEAKKSKGKKSKTEKAVETVLFESSDEEGDAPSTRELASGEAKEGSSSGESEDDGKESQGKVSPVTSRATMRSIGLDSDSDGDVDFAAAPVIGKRSLNDDDEEEEGRPTKSPRKE